jgi:hypothetical protein
MMEGILSSETSILTTVTWRNIQEDGILHSHRSENLKSHNTNVHLQIVLNSPRAVVSIHKYMSYIHTASRHKCIHSGSTCSVHISHHLFNIIIVHQYLVADNQVFKHRHSPTLYWRLHYGRVSICIHCAHLKTCFGHNYKHISCHAYRLLSKRVAKLVRFFMVDT